MNAPSSTIKAAGIGGLLAGVPIGNYIGGIIAGLINVNWPAAYAAMAQVADVKSAICGIITVLVAVAIGYKKKEYVLK